MRRPGARVVASGSSGDGSWVGSYMAPRLAAFAGLAEGEDGVYSDQFDRYGPTGAITHFRPYWARSAPGGGTVTHDIANGASGSPGGLAVFYNTSGDFDVNSLTWRGPNLFLDHADLRFGIGFRMFVSSSPADSASLAWTFGLAGSGPGPYSFFGVVGGTSQTH